MRKQGREYKDMENENRFQINMPANVKTRVEIINGIGIQEMIITGVVGTIAVLIALIYNAIFNNYIVALGIWGLVTGVTFISVMKDKYNTCIAELVGNIIKFCQGQKIFMYVVKEE